MAQEPTDGRGGLPPLASPKAVIGARRQAIVCGCLAILPYFARAGAIGIKKRRRLLDQQNMVAHKKDHRHHKKKGWRQRPHRLPFYRVKDATQLGQ